MDAVWDEMPAYWDELQGDEGDLRHRTLIDPALFAVLGPVNCLGMLNLGCGNGYVARTGHLRIPQAAPVVVPGLQGSGARRDCIRGAGADRGVRGRRAEGAVDGSELPTHCVIEARKIDGLDTTAV